MPFEKKSGINKACTEPGKPLLQNHPTKAPKSPAYKQESANTSGKK